jgi:peptide/nickel transport system substrate-binding protein
MEIVVETAGEDTEQTDVLELVHDSWRSVGIKLFSRPSQREVFRNRIFAGETVMSIWSGLENGLPNAESNPDEIAPTSQQQLQWPKWGQYNETRGVSGEPVDIPAARELFDLQKQWSNAATHSEREAIWHRMLAIYTENVFTIGLVAGVLQPVVISNQLRNVPVEGIYNWSPGAHFGMYKPDCFWFDSPDTRESG